MLLDVLERLWVIIEAKYGLSIDHFQNFQVNFFIIFHVLWFWWSLAHEQEHRNSTVHLLRVLLDVLERLWVTIEAKYSLSIDHFQNFPVIFFIIFHVLWWLWSPACEQEHRNSTVHLLRVLLDVLERLWVIIEAKYGLLIDHFQNFQVNFFIIFHVLSWSWSLSHVPEHRNSTVHLLTVLLDVLERLWVIIDAKYGWSIDHFQNFQVYFFIIFHVLWWLWSPAPEQEHRNSTVPLLRVLLDVLERLWVIIEAKYCLSIDHFQNFQVNFFIIFQVLWWLWSPACEQEHRNSTVHFLRVLLDMLVRLWVIIEAKYGLSIDHFQNFQVNFFIIFHVLWWL